MSLAVHQLFSKPKQDWLTACQSLQQQGEAYCIVTIIAEVGSLPRGTGSKIVVTHSHQFDTLGGGQLEFEVIRQAREGLIERQANGELSTLHIEKFSLAADLAQCCGGAAQVMFEYMNTQLPRVVVFGAGHVCHSLTAILKELPCHLLVVDSRKSWLESLQQQGISTMLYEEPCAAIDQLSADSHLLIMTHEHRQDFDITRLALERNCFPFIGLIASASKKQRFSFRLKEQLSAPDLLAQLTCPIGRSDIQGKLPMQVAVSISAQLMGIFEKRQAPKGATKQIHEKQWANANKVATVLQKKETGTAGKRF